VRLLVRSALQARHLARRLPQHIATPHVETQSQLPNARMPTPFGVCAKPLIRGGESSVRHSVVSAAEDFHLAKETWHCIPTALGKVPRTSPSKMWQQLLQFMQSLWSNLRMIHSHREEFRSSKFPAASSQLSLPLLLFTRFSEFVGLAMTHGIFSSSIVRNSTLYS